MFCLSFSPLPRRSSMFTEHYPFWPLLHGQGWMPDSEAASQFLSWDFKPWDNGWVGGSRLNQVLAELVECGPKPSSQLPVFVIRRPFNKALLNTDGVLCRSLLSWNLQTCLSWGRLFDFWISLSFLLIKKINLIFIWPSLNIFLFFIHTNSWIEQRQ